jgi:hypothetical protein
MEVRSMKYARLTVRLIGIGEARAEGLPAALMLTLLVLIAMILAAYGSA